MSEMYSKEEVLNAFDVALVSASNKVKIKNKAKTELKYRFLDELGIDYTALIFYKDDVQKMQIKALCPQDGIVREFERCIAVTSKAYKKLRLLKAVKKRTVIYENDKFEEMLKHPMAKAWDYKIGGDDSPCD